jgi:hypothetical protein
MAKRRGYTISKTRRLDRDAADWGTWTVDPPKGKRVILADLDALEEFLNRPSARRSLPPGGRAAR